MISSTVNYSDMNAQTLANYLGQEVQVFTEMEDGLVDAKYSGTLTQVSLDGFVHVGANGGWISKRIREVRLLLTPLSKITDEDLKELHYLLFELYAYRHSTLESLKDNLKVIQSESLNLNSKAIDFLRSRGYAVGLKEDEYIDKTK